MEIFNETKAVTDLSKSELDKIFLLVKPYYIDPSKVIDRELKHNNRIYLLKDTSDIILSFFMVAWEKHFVQGIERDCVYLGLSCAKQTNQHKGLASKVYYHFTIDAFDYERANNKRIILYGTTATPVVLLTLSKIWDSVQPDLNGNYSINDKEIIEDIKKSTGLEKFSTNHPFVLKGVALHTNYSPTEKSRLKELEVKNDIKTFDDLNIDEVNGDRLLITCRIPEKSKLDLLKAKLFE